MEEVVNQDVEIMGTIIIKFFLEDDEVQSVQVISSELNEFRSGQWLDNVIFPGGEVCILELPYGEYSAIIEAEGKSLDSKYCFATLHVYEFYSYDEEAA
ncbi:MAG: hypothetical protein NT091_02115 [Candidatus Falkowbacteria bacterium]|nr:hypothetical protein [Candidatus Falkowbacteria bacterium]